MKLQFSHDGIGSNVRHIYRDELGGFWFGGLEGLVRYHDGIMEQISREEGFTDTSVNCIYSPSPGVFMLADGIN